MALRRPQAASCNQETRMLRKLLLAIAATGSLGALLPTAAIAQREIIVQVAPPPPRNETMPQARRGYVWQPGHWQWNGRRHVWAQGTWLRERRGYAYSEPRWVERNGQWVFERPNWRRGGGQGDRDRDVISNRTDRDRDGDGVNNRRDAAPNNPNRN
jgi:hypothetical protein